MAKLNLLPKARQQLQAQLSDLRLKDDEMPATLGDGQGNVRIDQTHSWARVGESRTVMQVWNDKVPHIDGWEVIVGYEPGQNLFRVLRAREPYQERPYALMGEHGASHSMFHPDGGHDITPVDIRQWMPWRVFPSSTFTVSVWYGVQFRDGAWNLTEIQTLDLSASQPADGALYVLITLDADGVLAATAGTAVADKYSLTAADIPVPASGHYPLAAVRLYDSQTAIQEQRDDTDIVDLRYPPYTTLAPASATGGIDWENVVVVAGSGGDYTLIQSAVSAEVSGTCILVAPGTYAETVSLPAAKSLFLTSIDGARQAIVAPAAGVALTLSPAGDFQTVNGLRLTPPASAVALTIGSGATGTVRIDRSFIGANGAASVDASAAAAALDLAFRDCYLQGDLSTKALTALTDCDIAGNLTQAASAGNLTIDGGNIDGDLTHVAGSTITLRNLPRIAGTVSGAGTIVGAYLDSNGRLVLPGQGSTTGFSMGGDFQMFRNAADVGRTPDSLQVDGRILLSDGSFSAPALTFSSEPSTDTGIYRANDNVIGFATAGAEALKIDNADVTVISPLGLIVQSMASGDTVDLVPTVDIAGQFQTTNDFKFNLSTGQLRLTAQGSGGGVLIGGDVQLYRGAANTWYTGTSDGLYIDQANLTLATGADAGSLIITGNAASNRSINFQTAGTNRWLFRANSTAESGSNVGSDLVINARADDGTAIGDVLLLQRATRNIGLFGITAFGTSAAGVLGIANAGTVPGSSPANMIQVYSKDSSVGAANATLAIRTEQAVEAIGTFTASHKLRIWINEVEYWVELDAV